MYDSRFFFCILLLFAASGCGRKQDMSVVVLSTPSTTLSDRLTSVARKRIFFGHQSVGANILDGIRDLAVGYPAAKLQIAKFDSTISFRDAAFLEGPVGMNGNPESKNESFARALDTLAGAPPVIAFYKYC